MSPPLAKVEIDPILPILIENGVICLTSGRGFWDVVFYVYDEAMTTYSTLI